MSDHEGNVNHIPSYLRIYDYDYVDRELVVNAVEAEVVRMIYPVYSTQLLGLIKQYDMAADPAMAPEQYTIDST